MLPGVKDLLEISAKDALILVVDNFRVALSSFKTSSSWFHFIGSKNKLDNRKPKVNNINKSSVG